MLKDRNIIVREQIIKNSDHIVIKVGTRLLTDTKRIAVFIDGINALRKKGKKVLLVTSGAVGLGMQQLGLKKRPSRLSDIQALAAIGQSKLMEIYELECRRNGFLPAQLLLTADDLRDRERHLNVLNCINSLWANDILPIINENDSVSVDELKFGDNDILSALLATMTRTPLTIILTTEDGLRERNNGKLGARVSLVEKLDDKLRASASGTDSSTFSIGGMISKLRAADIINSAGDYLWIADGRKDSTLGDILRGEDVGTIFVPEKKHRLQSKKRWIKYFSRCHGKIAIDGGAVEALCKKGRSLLPSGVVNVTGKFKRGDTLEVLDPDGNIIGRGLSNFSYDECLQVIGRQSGDVKKILGCDADEEIIHRNHFAIFS
jgi:glutamate 5-kinase